MKTSLLIITCLLALGSFSVVAQDAQTVHWVKRGPLQTCSGNHSAFRVDSLEAYVVGGQMIDLVQGCISRTLDGGQSWQIVHQEPDVDIKHVYAFDPQHRVLLAQVLTNLDQDPEPEDMLARWAILKQEADGRPGPVLLELTPLIGGVPARFLGCFPNGSAYARFHYGTGTDSGHVVLRSRDYGVTWDTAYRVPRKGNGRFWYAREEVFVPAPGIGHVFHFDEQGILTDIESTYNDGQS